MRLPVEVLQLAWVQVEGTVLWAGARKHRSRAHVYALDILSVKSPCGIFTVQWAGRKFYKEEPINIPEVGATVRLYLHACKNAIAATRHLPCGVKPQEVLTYTEAMELADPQRFAATP